MHEQLYVYEANVKTSLLPTQSHMERLRGRERTKIVFQNSKVKQTLRNPISVLGLFLVKNKSLGYSSLYYEPNILNYTPNKKCLLKGVQVTIQYYLYQFHYDTNSQ